MLLQQAVRTGRMDHGHGRRRQVEAALGGNVADVLPPAAVPAEQHGRVELDRTLQALMTLPEEQREVLVLVAIEGLAYKEAAELLDIPVGTLMSRLGRARAALRQATGHGAALDGSGRDGPALRVVR